MHPLTLTNPSRVIVPLGTAVLALIMFVPPIVLVGVPGENALRAPSALTLSEDGLKVHRLLNEKTYAFTHVRKWFFAIPDGRPTQSPPATNGVLYVVLDDRTRFRAEVTAEEAAHISALLSSHVARASGT